MLGSLWTLYASFGLVASYKRVLLLPACTLLSVTLMVVVPLGLLIWGIEKHPEATGDFFSALYFITVAAAKDGNWSLAVTSADYSIALTGLAGPEGDGSDTKVGELWIAWGDAAARTYSAQSFHLDLSRDEFRLTACGVALDGFIERFV